MTLIYWMLGAISIAVLICAAAAALDASGIVTRGIGATRRWIWCWAILTSVSLPLALLARPREFDVVNSIVGAGASIQQVAGVQVDPVHVVIALWFALSLGAAIILIRTHLHLRSCIDQSRRAALDGQEVLVSQDFGPAVIGFTRPVIVVPQWVLDLSAHDRDMIVLHEREHVRAYDQLLVLLSTALAVAFPWNPALWYQLHRLKCAIELDCDARVVARVGDRVGYANILLRASTLSSSAIGALALAAPRTFAGIRIETLVSPKKRSFRARHALRASALACLIVGVNVPLPRLGGARPLSASPATASLTAAQPAAPAMPSIVSPQPGLIAAAPTTASGSGAAAGTGGEAVHVVTQESAYGTSAFLERAGLDSLSDQVTVTATGEQRAGGIQRGGISERGAAMRQHYDSVGAALRYRLEVARVPASGNTPASARITARQIPPTDTLNR